ncbi:MAG: hypothetical protein ABIR92_01015 [Gemmatimonadaceae bacterium]
MRTILLSLTAIAVLSPALLAQRRVEGLPLSGGDIERLNPAHVVARHQKALKLEQRQLAVLDTLRMAFDRDGRRMADSVRKYQRAITTAPPLLRKAPETRPVTRKDSLDRAKLDSTNRVKRDKYFEQVTGGRRDLASALLALKELFDTNVTIVSGALNPDQQNGTVLALEAASEEFTRRLRLANIR